MGKDRLEQLVRQGVSLQRIADALGVDRSTARRRLRRAGLETRGMEVRRLNREARAASAKELERLCPAHGLTWFRKDARGTFRCTRCNVDRVASRRRRVKEILVAEAGGRCVLCGYDRCMRALEFHHVDPAGKAFNVALRGVTRSLERARAEARKCALLCSNCHMEVEAGLASLP
jgi:transposase-like protein